MSKGDARSKDGGKDKRTLAHHSSRQLRGDAENLKRFGRSQTIVAQNDARGAAVIGKSHQLTLTMRKIFADAPTRTTEPRSTISARP